MYRELNSPVSCANAVERGKSPSVRFFHKFGQISHQSSAVCSLHFAALSSDGLSVPRSVCDGVSVRGVASVAGLSVCVDVWTIEKLTKSGRRKRRARQPAADGREEEKPCLLFISAQRHARDSPNLTFFGISVRPEVNHTSFRLGRCISTFKWTKPMALQAGRTVLCRIFSYFCTHIMSV